MENLTYRQLLELLNKMTPEQLTLNISIFDGRNEYMPVVAMAYADPENCDVLDPGHPFLICA
jgi:hypothetical protein